MSVDEISGGRAEVSMPYNPQLVGDPKRGTLHGGAVSALMDTCSGVAVICHPNSGETSATINLRIDYMRGATPGARIIAKTSVFTSPRGGVCSCRGHR